MHVLATLFLVVCTSSESIDNISELQSVHDPYYNTIAVL